jgi:hypothetical protein
MPSIAGPSHLPYSHIIRLSRHFRSRGYATPPSTADDSAQDPPLPFPLDTDTPPAPREEEMDRDARALALREKKLWASGRGFAQWKRLFGNPYAYHTKGDRAKWLGGGVVRRSARTVGVRLKED